MKPIFTKTISHPEYAHLQVVFEAHDEDIDPSEELEDENDITNAYQGYSHWFSATVKVELAGTTIFGMDTLGCCSYSSFEEFMQDAYFNDMIEQATQDLINDLNDTTDKINEFTEEYNKAS